MDLTLTPKKLRQNLTRVLAARLVPIVTSSPGVGKSDIAQSIADEYRLLLIDFRLGQADITDVNGLPRFFTRIRADGTPDHRAEFVPFDTFPLEGDELPDHPDGGKYEGWLLFFDEINVANKQLQAAAYKILLNRMVGNRRLHEQVVMMAAGNLATDNAVVHSMSTALQSRLIHFELHVSLEDWMDWAIAKNIDNRILAFLNFRPNQLMNFSPTHQDKTFACPRTWEFAHRLIHKYPTVTIEDLPLLGGTIGSGAAMEFITFVEIYGQLPDYKDIVKSPLGVQFPDEPSVKFALATMLAEKIDKATVVPAITCLQRLPIENQVLALRIIRQRNGALLREQVVSDLFQKLLQKM
jgi:hypothetical protein